MKDLFETDLEYVFGGVGAAGATSISGDDLIEYVTEVGGYISGLLHGLYESL